MSTAVQYDETLVEPLPGGQSEFLRDWSHRYVALEGGWAAGKTWAGSLKLLLLHLCNAVRLDGSITGVWSALLGATYRGIFDTDVPAIEDHARRMNLGYRIDGSAGFISFPDLGTKANPSLLLLRSAERPELITGWEVGAFWCDEPARYREDRTDPKRDPLIQIKGRLRAPLARLQQGVYTYTNEGDHTRIYEEFHGVSTVHAIYRAATAHNQHVVEFYRDMLQTLTPDLREQYLDGAAVSLRNQRAYTQYDFHRNVDPKVCLADGLPLHLSLDFNIAPGMHAEIGQYDPTQDLFTVIHEFFRPRLDVRSLMLDFARWLASSGGWRWPELHIFGDPAGQSQWAGTAESCYGIIVQSLEILRQEKYPQMRYVLRVAGQAPPQVDRVNAFNLALSDLTGAVHYRLHPSCSKLIESLSRQRWDDKGHLDEAGGGLGHATDAEGYRVHFLRPVRINRPRAAGRFGVNA